MTPGSSPGIPRRPPPFVIDDGGRTEAFDTLVGAGIDAPEGIWSDGSTMWVSTRGGIFAFDMQTKGRDSAKDVTLDSAAGNIDPQDIWGDDKTLWVGEGVDTGTDGIFGYIYAYKLDISNDGTVRPGPRRPR